MDTPSQVLADVIVHSKYARWWGELGRRETFEEVVARNRVMLLDRLDELGRSEPQRLEARREIDLAYRHVYAGRVLPAMRSLQFAGAPIHRDHNRIYNCGYMHANRTAFFKELMFLLLGGSGIGYSVQRHHVLSLPPLRLDRTWASRQRHVVQDSVIGWADAVDALVLSWLAYAPVPEFDFREVRPAGSILKTSGGKAPGPGPLRAALERIDAVFEAARRSERQLRLEPIDVHDIACHIADAVLAGGIRRSAMISLFSPDDLDMLYAKTGDWWEEDAEPQRALANNSAVLLRGEDEDRFDAVFAALRHSGGGDPGIFWTNNREIGTNPCAEIALHDKQFCNLTTINVGDVEDQEDLDARAEAAAILGTVQATFTDFHYLDPGWRKQTEREYLVGVSMTGIAAGRVLDLNLTRAADIARGANARMALLLGIQPAARVTTVKPEGTASLVVGTSSGIHAWHDAHYIRRVRFHKSVAVAQYLMGKLPYRPEHVAHDPWPIEDLVGDPDQIVLTVPQRAPGGAATRDEGAIALLERVANVTRRWVWTGHRHGENHNNVSTTVNIQPHEWDDVSTWLQHNRDLYSGVALLPFDGGNYTQAPFETITAETYQRLAGLFTDIDVREIDETADYTTLAGEAACAGGACEVTFA